MKQSKKNLLQQWQCEAGSTSLVFSENAVCAGVPVIFAKKLRRLHCVGVTYRVADVTDNIYKTDI